MTRQFGNHLLKGCTLLFVGAAMLFATHCGFAEDATATNAPSTYWAYRPVTRPAIPQVKHSDSVRTPIDAFILARLEKVGLQFSSPASKRELIRRATFDLHGLPPTPEDVEAFVNDSSSDAYEKLLDRLLASPHYGERWGRMWLDVVRYADTAGYNADPLRPLAYKYRDYVIRAFNEDMPYDRFVQEQLAGDELFPDDADAQIATGFNRLPPDESNASNILLARQDTLNDLTTAVGAVFLAQSLGCAQCHDHKFDTITQKDFYRIQAFFAGVIPADKIPLGNAEQQVEYQRKLDAWREQTAKLRTEMQQLEWEGRATGWKDKRTRFPELVWQALSVPPEDRTAFEHQLSFYSGRQVDVKEKEMTAKFSDDQKQRFEELKAEISKLEKTRPQPPKMIETMASLDGRETPKTHMLAGGSYNKPQEEVQPGFLSALLPKGQEEAPAEIAPPRPGTVGRRTTLARWLTDVNNPLPARVMVNRIWQGHFGKGIAENANDFGVQSPAPTHPELLDWLASEFVSGQWTVKRLHKLIMLSAVYRQSTERLTANKPLPRGVEVDSENELYWHYPRRRLEAENLRDSLLAVSGLLNPEMYGPGVRPELPPNFQTKESWNVSTDKADHFRRSVYVLSKRNLPFPLLQAFDLPDTFESCARRPVTTTAPQALMLLNNDTVLGYAQGFAGRLMAAKPQADGETLVRGAYELAFGRDPSAEENRTALDFLERQERVISARLYAGEPVLLPSGFPKFADPVRSAALVDFCHALLNANEFVYVD